MNEAEMSEAKVEAIENKEKINPMRRPRIEKITINIGVGEGGKKLENAQKILQQITGQKAVLTKAKKSIPGFGIKKKERIGCKLTLRGNAAKNFLKTALKIKGKLSESCFDKEGNFAFGIEEHTDFPGVEYNPEVGIFGMDIAVSLKRPGYRVAKRRVAKCKIPRIHRLTKEEAIAYVKEEFGVEVV
ncbi:MAG: 50S ribosomal protein L5 [Methanocellales archaeon]